MSIEIKDLSVHFKNGTIALNHVNLTINEGIHGLLGENGAGKTTLMRVLTTIIKPTDGQVILNGTELKEGDYGKIQRKIGYLPQELGLYPNLSVRETLEYMGGLSRVTKTDCKKRIDYYLEKTGLAEHQKKKNRQLSGGMKRRVGLIQALLNDPKILIVDEPTTGLDPEERIRIRNLLVDFSKDKIVLFSTHVMEDMAATCNSLSILNKGNVIYDGDKISLLRKAMNHVFTCRLNGEEELEQIQRNYPVSLKNYSGDGIEVRIIAQDKPNILCQTVEPTLEDAYLSVMRL